MFMPLQFMKPERMPTTGKVPISTKMYLVHQGRAGTFWDKWLQVNEVNGCTQGRIQNGAAPRAELLNHT